jgi:hypothetical protein
MSGMSKTPGTVSKILWHFTGGPVWNPQTRRQNDRPKPVKDSYRALKAILESKVVLAGKSEEIFKTQRPASEDPILAASGEDLEGMSLISFKPTSNVVCVADIPIQHLHYHAKRYGRMAIGFKREAILRELFNPVLYTLENSELNRVLHKLHSELRQSNKYFDWENHAQCEELIRLAEESEERALSVLSWVKTFSESEFHSIYCEREWRKVGNFGFQYSDIELIVLPKAGGHYDRLNSYFGREIEAPIVPWETLIEH